MARILLIEDSAVDAKAVRTLLEGFGHEVFWAAGPRQSMEFLFPAGRLDLVISDILMPDLDGLSLINHLQASHPGLPFLAITASPELVLEATAESFGVKRVLRKPIEPEILRAAVDEALATA
jgi:CheY-like chemotaxis protein